jgi:hypothetical protein
MLRLMELTAKVSGSQVSDAVELRDVRVEVDRDVEAGAPGDLRAQPNAEGGGGFERIDHVEIVRPGLRKILPGVCARVRCHEPLGPVGRGPGSVVALQRDLVILTLVAEQLSKLIEGGRIRHQVIPVIVSDLVPEMTEQRAVRLGQGLALALALDVVGFRHIERDEPAGMPGDNSKLRQRSVGRRREKVECQPVRIVSPGGQRQVQLQERIEQPMLGELDPAPMQEVLRL